MQKESDHMALALAERSEPNRLNAAVPAQSFEFICEWFERAAKNAAATGKRDSATLWNDGLAQLRYMEAINAELIAALEMAKHSVAQCGTDQQMIQVLEALKRAGV